MAGSISVLMPVLNEETSVVGAITSVLEQEGPEVEVLVIDGHSTDRTRDLVHGMAQHDRRIRLLENPAVTIPAGLNVGLAEVTGDFVARVDGHATISRDYLKRALSHLKAEPSMAGVGGRRVGVSSDPVGRAIALALSSRFGVGNSINHYADGAQLTDHASFGVYRTEAAKRVGGWDETLPVNEDVDFDHRILQAGHTIGFDPQMVIHWQVRERIGDLFRQYRRYGRGKSAMIKKNGLKALRLRHALPPAAVLTAGGLLVASFRHPRLLLAPLVYAVGTSAASVRAWRRRTGDETVSALALPLAFPAMHSGWGIGFVEGLVLNKTPGRASGDPRVNAP